MKSLYDKITDELDLLDEEAARDAVLKREMMAACRVTKDGRWTVSEDGYIKMYGRLCCRFDIRKGTITVSDHEGSRIADFDDVDPATTLVARIVAKAHRRYDREREQAQTSVQEEPVRVKTPSKPLYPV